MTEFENFTLSLKGTSFNVSFLYDLEQRQFMFVNASLLSLSGLQSSNFDRIIGQIHPEDLDRLKKCFDEFVDGEFIGSVQFRLIIAEEIIWIRASPLMLQSSGGRIILCNVSNITAEIENLYNIQKYANKKNSILNMLSHDLRGPLGVARNLAEVLEEKIGDPKLTAPARNLSVIIKKSIDLITDLTSRELLDTMEVQLVKKNINIAAKTEEYMEECRRSQDLAGRTLTFKASHPEIYVDLDEAKFMQVYNNLLSNALKFTRQGDQILLTIEDLGDDVLFMFHDSGIGIPQKLIPFVFDEFTEAKRPGLNGEPTIGLGLYIVKTIIDWHNGIIWVACEENSGTTFFIKIPKRAN